MKNKKSNASQIGGFLIAVVILVLFFYKNEAKPERSDLSQRAQKNFDTGQVNALQEIQNYTEQQKIIESQNRQPFTKNVMNKFPVDGSLKGSFQFETNEKDAVFLVREKYTNTLYVVVQLPKFDKAEMMVPLGEYTVEYAIGDGNWQGLDRFWGYSTQFYRSNLEHRVYRVETFNGYTTYGTGIILNSPNGKIPAKINKKAFIE